VERILEKFATFHATASSLKHTTNFPWTFPTVQQKD